MEWPSKVFSSVISRSSCQKLPVFSSRGAAFDACSRGTLSALVDRRFLFGAIAVLFVQIIPGIDQTRI